MRSTEFSEERVSHNLRASGGWHHGGAHRHDAPYRHRGGRRILRGGRRPDRRLPRRRRVRPHTPRRCYHLFRGESAHESLFVPSTDLTSTSPSPLRHPTQPQDSHGRRRRAGAPGRPLPRRAREARREGCRRGPRRRDHRHKHGGQIHRTREGRVGYVRAEPAAPPRVARARLGHERAHPAGEAREGRTGIRDARQRKVRLFSFLFPYRQFD